jgi:hypothetical protein
LAGWRRWRYLHTR